MRQAFEQYALSERPLPASSVNHLRHCTHARKFRSSKKSGTRLIASIKESRPPAARRRDQLRRPDRTILCPARPCNDAHAARAEILLEHHAFSRQVVPLPPDCPHCSPFATCGRYSGGRRINFACASPTV